MPPQLQQRRERAAPRNPVAPRADEQRRRRERAAPRRNDFVGVGFAAALISVTFLNHRVVDVGGGGPVVGVVDRWQVILAFAVMAAGLLSVMYGMRRVREGEGDAPAPPFVRRGADPVLWDAGGQGPERMLPLVILLLCPLLEACFDFF